MQHVYARCRGIRSASGLEFAFQAQYYVIQLQYVRKGILLLSSQIKKTKLHPTSCFTYYFFCRFRVLEKTLSFFFKFEASISFNSNRIWKIVGSFMATDKKYLRNFLHNFRFEDIRILIMLWHGSLIWQCYIFMSNFSTLLSNGSYGGN